MKQAKAKQVPFEVGLESEIKALFDRYYKQMLSESIKRGTAAKKAENADT